MDNTPEITPEELEKYIKETEQETQNEVGEDKEGE